MLSTRDWLLRDLNEYHEKINRLHKAASKAVKQLRELRDELFLPSSVCSAEEKGE